MPLRLAIPLALLLFGLAVIVFQALFFARYNMEEASRSTVQRCKQVGTRAARLAVRHLPRRERTIFKLELARIDLEPGVDWALLCDARGIINSAKHAPLMGRAMDSLLTPEAVDTIRLALSENLNVTEFTRDGTAVIGAYPAQLPTGEMYAVFLQLNLTDPLQRARQAAIEQAAAAGVVLLLCCGVLWFILNKVITRRVSHIVSGALDLGAGRVPAPALSGSDELANIDRAMRSAHATVAGQAAEVRAQRERYRRMVDSLPVAVITLRSGLIDFINPAGAKLLRLGTAAANTEVTSQLRGILNFAKNHLELQSPWPQDYRFQQEDGQELLLEVVAYHFEDAQGQALQLVINDVSERRALEAKKEALGHEIANASEREQRRIGQDLHDDICQRLAAVKMAMQDFEEQVADSAPMLVDQADEIVSRLTDAIHVTRSLARGLTPVDIEAGGLGVALDGLARTAREVMGVECKIDLPEQLPPLTQHVATQLYRITQECINNAAKHARASQVTVEIDITADERLLLRVINNGRPFGELSGSKVNGSSSGMGLHIMRYRADSMDGVIDFDTQPAHGTTMVSCVIPLQPHALSI
jgi:signal transduction histidine kinase